MRQYSVKIIAFAVVTSATLPQCRTPKDALESAPASMPAAPVSSANADVTGGGAAALDHVGGVTAAKGELIAAAGAADSMSDAACSGFKAHEGVAVTSRDAHGEATAGTIQVLAGNPHDDIWIIGAFNEWGKSRLEADHLKPIPGSPYFAGQVRHLTHAMHYRLLVNGVPVVDPAGVAFAPAPEPLDSVFWDSGRPGAFKPRAHAVDLRAQPLIIAEVEVDELARKWRFQGRVGPTRLAATYSFIADSGLIAELKNSGYNAIALLPVNASVDGQSWRERYQVFGPFAPDARYGTPDDFARMIDGFNLAGIAVILEPMIINYATGANLGQRGFGLLSLEKWHRSDGSALLGGEVSRNSGNDAGAALDNVYDFSDSGVRRYLSDSVIHMVCRYGISGIRAETGPRRDRMVAGAALSRTGDPENDDWGAGKFFAHLATQVRSYRPELLVVDSAQLPAAGDLAGLPSSKTRLGSAGNYRADAALFDFFHDNMQRPSAGIDMARLQAALAQHTNTFGAQGIEFISDHGEAVSKTSTSSGAGTGPGTYVASQLAAGASSNAWYYVEKKAMAFASLALLSGAAYLDIPQLRLLQEGSLTENAAIEWDRRYQDQARRSYAYFGMLSRLVRDHAAFSQSRGTLTTDTYIDTESGRRIATWTRRDGVTGKRYLIVVNLSHVGLSNYPIGTDGAQTYKVMLDGDAAAFGGTGEMEKRLPGGSLVADGEGRNGKSTSLALPFLAPYAAVVLESL